MPTLSTAELHSCPPLGSEVEPASTKHLDAAADHIFINKLIFLLLETQICV